MYGGSGLDHFVFSSVLESPAGGARDTIADFVPGLDRINLSGFDADAAAAGVQDFSFIGERGFGGQAGQLRHAQGVLSADVNGDRVADFAVTVTGAARLSENDVIF